LGTTIVTALGFVSLGIGLLVSVGLTAPIADSLAAAKS